MKNKQVLQQMLFSLDGKGYPAYKDLKGSYDFGEYQLIIDHVQADPFAPPSKVRILMEHRVAKIPQRLFDTKEKGIATRDFLARTVDQRLRSIHTRGKGSGGSGAILIDRCGQEILERTSVLIHEKGIEVRLEVGLPAAGRRILGKEAAEIFLEILPQVIGNSLMYANIDQKALEAQVTLYLDQNHIREELRKRNLVAFIGNGAILPRESGISDRPMTKGATAFQSPETLLVEMDLPSGGKIQGMGIPRGITLIVGGGYHGKSTLLRALELGVYNHIPGDGREWVITVADGVKIRAEDGRSVEKVNISPFINNLPNGKNTVQFTTENASGSTSQGTNVMEALEAKASLLLVDEDTSATNFMIRDRRMQALVAKEKEPITPFVQKIRPLYQELGVSTILIVGGSGDYFDVADLVIMLDEYVPKDVTQEAKAIAKEFERERLVDEGTPFGPVTPRIPLTKGFKKKDARDRFKAKGKETILFGKSPIDLSALEQLVSPSQTNAIALMLDLLGKEIYNNTLTLYQGVEALYQRIEKEGLDAVAPSGSYPGNLALPRKQEVCAALNRYRGLECKEGLGIK